MPTVKQRMHRKHVHQVTLIKQQFQNQATHISPIKASAEGNACKGQIGGI